MRKSLLFLLALAPLAMTAQDGPVFKVDFDMTGRNTSEVTEPGYTAWPVASKVASETKTFTAYDEQGVPTTITVTVAATNPSQGLLKTNWSKALIQNPYYARLVNDGITISKDGESYDEFALDRGGIELRIKGLPAGHRTLQTFNNSWENGDSFEMVPMDVFLNGAKVIDNLVPTVRATSNELASRCYFEFDVAGPEETTIVRFMPHEGYVRQTDKPYFYNRVFIDGFEIGLPNADQQASNPYPADADMHADADGGSITLRWSPAKGCTQHTLFLGTDSISLTQMKGIALTDTTYLLSDLSDLNTYYWRVDEDGTPGPVWSFRPRHLAFRGAEGYGRFAMGGRGGKVVHVTNLNDSGEGSFRWALTDVKGPRTIVFDVSGIIHLQSRLTCSDPYVTVAGQTAPGKGICFRSAPLGLGDDGVWRFVRMRLGGGHTYDGIGAAGTNHSILDHASISWTIDEAFSSRNAKNITLQHTLISEALNVAGHENYPAGTGHGYAGSVGGDVASLHHNLLAHNQGRNWSLAGGLDGGGNYAGRLDIFNTVVYNWIKRTTDGGAHEVNFVGNYYKKGPESTLEDLLVAQLEGTGSGSQAYYYHNNIKAAQNGQILYDGTNDTQGRRYVLSGGQKLDWEVWNPEPFFPSYALVESASDAYKSVMSDVGCTMPMFDNHDQRIIREVLDGTYSYKGSYNGTRGIIDNEADCGGYEDYPEEHRSAGFDSDGDGLPDWWEAFFGSNPNSAVGDFSDANADADCDGYTDLENYLEWMARPHETVATADALLAVEETWGTTLFRNYKAPLTYELQDESLCDGLLHFITILATDAEGSVGRAYIARILDTANGLESLVAPAADGKARVILLDGRLQILLPDGRRLDLR